MSNNDAEFLRRGVLIDDLGSDESDQEDHEPNYAEEGENENETTSRGSRSNVVYMDTNGNAYETTRSRGSGTKSPKKPHVSFVNQEGPRITFGRNERPANTERQQPSSSNKNQYQQQPFQFKKQHQDKNQDKNQKNQANQYQSGKNQDKIKYTDVNGKQVPFVVPIKDGKQLIIQPQKGPHKNEFSSSMYSYKDINEKPKNLKFIDYPLFCRNVLHLWNIYNWKSESVAVGLQVLKAIVNLHESMQSRGADNSKYKKITLPASGMTDASRQQLIDYIKQVFQHMDIYKLSDLGFGEDKNVIDYIKAKFKGGNSEYIPENFTVINTHPKDSLLQSPSYINEDEINQKGYPYFNNVRLIVNSKNKLSFDDAERTVLYSMVSMGDIPDHIVAGIVNKFNSNLNLNYKDSSGKSFINYVVEKDYFITLVSLLGTGISIDVNVKNSRGESLCVSAIRQKSNKILDILLRFPGLRLGQQDYEGKNELVVAIEENNMFAIERLMARDKTLRSFTTYTHKLQTILMCALVAGFERIALDIAKALPNFILISDENGVSPLSFLLQKCSPNVNIYFQILMNNSELRIEQLQFIDDFNNSFLLLFLKYGLYQHAFNVINSEKVFFDNTPTSYKFIVNLNVLYKENIAGESPVGIIIKRKHSELYELVRKNFPKLFTGNIKDMAPFMFAAVKYSNLEVLQDFLGRATIPVSECLNPDNNNLLMYAIIEKNDTCVQKILGAMDRIGGSQKKDYLEKLCSQRNKLNQNAVFLSIIHSMTHVWNSFPDKISLIKTNLNDDSIDLEYQHTILSIALKMRNCLFLSVLENLGPRRGEFTIKIQILRTKYGFEKLRPMFWAVLSGLEIHATHLMPRNSENEENEETGENQEGPTFNINELYGIYENQNIFQVACKMKMSDVAFKLAHKYFFNPNSELTNLNCISIFDSIEAGLTNVSKEIFNKLKNSGSIANPVMLPGSKSGGKIVNKNILIWAIIYRDNILIKEIQTYLNSNDDAKMAVFDYTDENKKTVYDYSLLFIASEELKKWIFDSTSAEKKKQSAKYANIYTLAQNRISSETDTNLSNYEAANGEDLSNYTIFEFNDSAQQKFGTALLSPARLDFYKNNLIIACGIVHAFTTIIGYNNDITTFRCMCVRRGIELYEYVLIQCESNNIYVQPEYLGNPDSVHTYEEIPNPPLYKSFRIYNPRTDSTSTFLCQNINAYKVFAYKTSTSRSDWERSNATIDIFGNFQLNIFLEKNDLIAIKLTSEQQHSLQITDVNTLYMSRKPLDSFFNKNIVGQFLTHYQVPYHNSNNAQIYIYVTCRSFNQILRDPNIFYANIKPRWLRYPNITLIGKSVPTKYFEISSAIKSPILDLANAALMN